MAEYLNEAGSALLSKVNVVALSIALIIFLLFLVLRRIFSRYISKLLLALTAKTKTSLDGLLVESFQKPIEMGFVFGGLYIALNYLGLKLVQHFAFHAFFRSVVIILVAWGFINLVKDYDVLNKELDKSNIKIDPILIPFLAQVGKTLILVITFLTVAQEWGYEMNTFLTGLGLGGLAFALAAQDAVANVFGGIVIITDKPFSIGDWIQTPSIEGTVEDITFRSTRIRTFADAVTTVPNSKLANESITNWSRMGKRRITFNLKVMYSTPREKLEKCIQKIRAMLSAHPEIDQEVIFVNLDQFNESSIDIFLYFFTKTTIWGRFLEVKEDVNLKIMEILEAEGVEVAFPARNLYIKTKE